ncbi:FAD dependent oxidoreductase [Mucilaginibacter yixingensis]|uniref:FAD dependent oxidoreductase n=1 Tax=Mucilaginibacter yixingensis TaxID=1295612 RepID=A0A2T5J5T7_9SPHI|nr:FAD-dependent oxidoreductase [Mucilaginibacter yixingensis]PTQ93242.1 FAD dependent oxidoreductase [Mucilaginibacter yixingensis]
MTKKLPVLLFILFFVATTFAETIKTNVLVVGGTASGTAAAVQSARSKVKTMLIEPGPWLGGEMTAGGMCILEGNKTMPSGVWGEFRSKVNEFYRHQPGFDTSATAPVRFEPFVGAAILKKLCDTVKNLTVKLKTPYTDVKKDGDGWEVTVTIDNKPVTIKAKVLVDATPWADLATKAGAVMTSGFDSRAETGEALAPEKALPLIEDVTWVAVVKDYGKTAHYLMPKPEDYDPSRYACLKGMDINKMLQGAKLPNSKYMIKWGECANSYGITVEDLSPEKREAFYKKLRLHTMGMIYFLQNEMGFKNIGIDDREFGSSDNLPYIPFIREYRRMTGDVRMTLNEIYTPYANNLYRTSIGVGDAGFGQHYEDPEAPKTNYPPLPAYTIPLGAIVCRNVTNLFVTEKGMSTTHLVNASTFYPSVQMTLGQGVGAAAAYCVFFEKTTKTLDVRTIQTEILDYHGMLYSFADVPVTDKYFRSLEQISATGLIKLVQETKGRTAQTLFKPDSVISTADVKPMLMDLYTRAFIWFGRNKPGEQFTVANLLSFICDQTLTDPKSFQMMMQNQWQDVYKFSKPFDMDRPCTRYEFAVLMNKYVNPFKTKVDVNGKVVN